MQNKSIANLPIAVSPFIYGTATSKMMAGENADEILDAAFEAGFTTFDTARLYGKAESVLGDWVRRRSLRGKVNILTKGCYPANDKPRVSPQVIREELEISLEQLQTDYVDIYLLHRDDPNVEVGPIVECLNQLKEEGKIKVFGGSNWTPQRLSQANEYASSHGLQPFSISSPSFSLVEMVRDPWGGSVWLSGPSRAADREWYVNNFCLFQPCQGISFRALSYGQWNGYRAVPVMGTDSGIWMP